MGCEKCNLAKNPTFKQCLRCWKRSDEENMRVISVDVARTGNNDHLMYTYSHTFTANSTTSAWDNWDNEDWYITTTGYTR